MSEPQKTDPGLVDVSDFMEWLNTHFEGICARLDLIESKLDAVKELSERLDRTEKLVLLNLPAHFD